MSSLTLELPVAFSVIQMPVIPCASFSGCLACEDNVATQCFATLGAHDVEVECENGSPCGDSERENPFQGAR